MAETTPVETWLTQEAHDRLQAELAHLTGPGRSEITARMTTRGRAGGGGQQPGRNQLFTVAAVWYAYWYGQPWNGGSPDGRIVSRPAKQAPTIARARLRCAVIDTTTALRQPSRSA